MLLHEPLRVPVILERIILFITGIHVSHDEQVLSVACTQTSVKFAIGPSMDVADDLLPIIVLDVAAILGFALEFAILVVGGDVLDAVGQNVDDQQAESDECEAHVGWLCFSLR